jgi:hypothetical protein
MEDGDRRVLGPVTRAGVYFAGRTGSCARVTEVVAGAKDGADGEGISAGTLQANTKAGSTGDISEEMRDAGVLPHHQIGTAVLVEISYGGAATFAISAKTADGGGSGFEAAVAVAEEEEGAAGIEARRVVGHREEVLGDDEVFVTVAVEVGDAEAEGG